MEKTNGIVGKYCGDGLLGCQDDEVRVSFMWEERGGRTSGDVCMDKGICKSRTAR